MTTASGNQQKLKEYRVEDCCMPLFTCGGHQKLILYEDYVEFENNVPWFWCGGIFALPFACVTCTTAKPYHTRQQQPCA